MLIRNEEHSRLWKSLVKSPYDRSKPGIFEKEQGGQGDGSGVKEVESSRK